MAGTLGLVLVMQAPAPELLHSLARDTTLLRKTVGTMVRQGRNTRCVPTGPKTLQEDRHLSLAAAAVFRSPAHAHSHGFL